jgi:DNA-binding transcriptional LysR family regulator
MELRHLRYFVAVAEELHFSRAAARLNIAQPPLSRQIRDLERELGAELLERVKRRVQLTPAGRAFLPEARLTLTQAERARRTAQRAARGEIGRLRVGFVEAATFSGILPDVLRFFRKHYPDVALELFELSSLQQAEALREGRIDVGLLHSPPPDAEQWLQVERILRDPLVAALPLGHRLARRARLTLRALAPEPLLLFPRQNGPALYDRIIAAYRAAGFSPSVVQEAAQMHTLAGLVAAGLGVALVPGSIVRLRRPGVVYRPVRDLKLDVGTWAVSKLGAESPVQASFLSVCGTQRSLARRLGRVAGCVSIIGPITGRRRKHHNPERGGAIPYKLSRAL